MRSKKTKELFKEIELLQVLLSKIGNLHDHLEETEKKTKTYNKDWNDFLEAFYSTVQKNIDDYLDECMRRIQPKYKDENSVQNEDEDEDEDQDDDDEYFVGI